LSRLPLWRDILPNPDAIPWFGEFSYFRTKS